MSTLNRTVVLDTLIKHETLIIHDIGKAENLGFVPNKEHLRLLVDELTESGYLNIMSGVTPMTYNITEKGIAEEQRLKEEV